VKAKQYDILKKIGKEKTISFTNPQALENRAEEEKK
jgi:hypothetical protein